MVISKICDAYRHFFDNSSFDERKDEPVKGEAKHSQAETQWWERSGCGCPSWP